jgi:hypothetical protein
VAFLPATGAGLVELRDDPAAVAIEHALLGERAVGPEGVDVRAPRLFAGAVDNGVALGCADAGFVGPLPAVGMAGGHPRLVGVETVAVVRRIGKVGHETSRSG